MSDGHDIFRVRRSLARIAPMARRLKNSALPGFASTVLSVPVPRAEDSSFPQSPSHRSRGAQFRRELNDALMKAFAPVEQSHNKPVSSRPRLQRPTTQVLLVEPRSRIPESNCPCPIILRRPFPNGMQPNLASFPDHFGRTPPSVHRAQCALDSMGLACMVAFNDQCVHRP